MSGWMHMLACLVMVKMLVSAAGRSIEFRDELNTEAHDDLRVVNYGVDQSHDDQGDKRRSTVEVKPPNSTKPSDSDSLTSTASSETAETAESSSYSSSSGTKSDLKTRQVSKHHSSSVGLLVGGAVTIFVLLVAIFICVYCYIHTRRRKQAADHQETKILNAKRNATQVQEFSSESL